MYQLSFCEIYLSLGIEFECIILPVSLTIDSDHGLVIAQKISQLQILHVLHDLLWLRHSLWVTSDATVMHWLRTCWCEVWVPPLSFLLRIYSILVYDQLTWLTSYFCISTLQCRFRSLKYFKLNFIAVIIVRSIFKTFFHSYWAVIYVNKGNRKEPRKSYCQVNIF
jgi:hypothetical protein